MVEKGGALGPKARDQIKRIVREDARKMMNEMPQRGRWQNNSGSGSTGSGLIVRFRIVASYFCGQCYADARVISVPYGVSLADLPDVDTYDNNAVRVYDRTGRYLNEPPEDLLNRIGYAQYMTPLEDGPCPDTYFSAWEIISLPCSEVTCD